MTGRPHVALLVETSSRYGRQILGGIRRYLRSFGPWSIYIEQRALTTREPAWLKTWRGDGIISRCTDDRISAFLATTDYPVVDLTDRFGDSGFPRIWSDHGAVGRMAALHLTERGFRSFAFCGFSEELWSLLRRQGFEQELASRGFPCEVFNSPWYISRTAPPWEEDQFRLASWVSKLAKPVGVLACNDVRGQQLLDACHSRGIGVPEKVAVIGVDNDELCHPPMSSVIPNAERIGYESAELLDRLMAGGDCERREVLIEPLDIKVRQSTETFAIDDPNVAAAMHFIRESACDGISVTDVTHHVGVSRSVLERRFRKYLNHTPQAAIRQVQLKQVKQLLAETELPLDRVAHLTGFHHPEYMCVVFKRELGITPGKYRRRIRGSEPASHYSAEFQSEGNRE